MSTPSMSLSMFTILLLISLRFIALRSAQISSDGNEIPPSSDGNEIPYSDGDAPPYQDDDYIDDNDRDYINDNNKDYINDEGLDDAHGDDGDYDDIGYMDTRGYVEVEVTACDGWDYGSYSNTLQIQLNGRYDSSHFFYVNQFGPLPVAGYTDIYMIELSMAESHLYYEELFSVMISFSDDYGYCLQRLSIRTMGGGYDMYYEFYELDFGLGLVVSHECKYSFHSLSKHWPLVRCIDDYLELYVIWKRGIYKLVPHACNNWVTEGITAEQMKGNVYTTIMGKNYNENVYVTTDPWHLDHYQVGYLDLTRLGHIIAGNVMLRQHSPHEGPLYTREIVGTLIGIKLEPVDKERYSSMGSSGVPGSGGGGGNYVGNIYFDEKDVDSLGIIINGKRRKIYGSMLLGMGRWLVAFLHFNDRVSVTEEQSAEIMIFGSVGHLYVNVYAIFEEYTHHYQLPWIIHGEPAPHPTPAPHGYDDKKKNVEEIEVDGEEIESDGDGDDYDDDDNKKYEVLGIDWFDAHKNCMEEHGTSLVSIHSKDEAFLMEGFIGHSRAWIGFVDFDINHMQNNKDGQCYNSNFGNGGNNNNNNNNGNGNDYHYKCEWKWIDGSSIDYVYWRKDMYHSYAFEDCAYIDAMKGGGWNNADCHSQKISKYICSSPYWFPNQKRKFELNMDVEVDAIWGFIPDISIVTLGNDNADHALCIDALSIDTFYNYIFPIFNTTEYNGYYGYYGHHYGGMQHVVIELTGSWIGGAGNDNHLYGIIKYPVCKTEVLDMEMDYDTASSALNPPDAPRPYMPDNSCGNEQRVDDNDRKSYCLVDQDYVFSRNTRYRVSSEDLDFFSFASVSKVTLYKHNTVTTTNDFRFDRRFTVNYANVINGTGVKNAMKPLIITPAHEWYDIEENVAHIPEDDKYTFFDKQQWARAAPMAQHCWGKAYLPTAHILTFDAFIHYIKIQVDIKSHLKLTLCPFLQTPNSKIVYESDISTQIFHFEPIGCHIHWKRPTYIANTKETADCAEEQRIALNMNINFLPNCNSTNPALYDGCQCNARHCWCSDPFGNKIGAQAMRIPINGSWQETCRLGLNCSNTEII